MKMVESRIFSIFPQWYLMNVGCRAWTKIFNARLLFLSLLHQEDIWRSHRANKLLLMQLNWILLEAHHFMLHYQLKGHPCIACIEDVSTTEKTTS